MLPNILQNIVEQKREELDEIQLILPEIELETMARQKTLNRRPFFKLLSTPGTSGKNIIAEFKRASPSKGMLSENLDPKTQAQAYERGGAAAISVLTEKVFFKGNPEDLTKVRSSVKIPVLRKDFIISEYQIYETVMMGADAVLLIVRILSPQKLSSLISVCNEFKLDTLVETHNAEEIQIATKAGAKLIGINNRDLATFKTNIDLSVNLAKQLNKNQVAVAESGIENRQDIEKLKAAGIWNFLIGEAAVKSGNPEKFLRGL